MTKINWGIVGLGNIAKSFASGFINSKNSNLLAIASRNKSKLETFKNQYKIEEKYSFNNYLDLLNCDEIDIVYISLPNSFHYKIIKDAIKSNKNILVEKPATQNFPEILEISRLLKKSKVFFGEGFMYRFHPQIRHILNCINNYEIGELISMDTSFGSNLLTKKKLFFFEKKKKINKDSRLFNKNLGGGCILDLGCYPISFSILIAATMETVNIKNFKLKNINLDYGNMDVDIDAQADLIFDNRFTSKIKSSFKNNIGQKSIILGTKGSMTIEDIFTGSGNIYINNHQKKYEIKNNINHNIFSYEINGISNSILSGSLNAIYPGMQIEETLLSMKIIDSWKNEK